MAKFRYLTVRTAVVSVGLVLVLGLLGYVLQLVLAGQLPEVYADIIITLVLLVAPFGITYLLRNALSLLVDAEALTPHQREVLYRFTQLFTFSGVLFIIVGIGLLFTSVPVERPQDGAVGGVEIEAHSGSVWRFLIVATCISASMSAMCGRVRMRSR